MKSLILKALLGLSCASTYACSTDYPTHYGAHEPAMGMKNQLRPLKPILKPAGSSHVTAVENYHPYPLVSLVPAPRSRVKILTEGREGLSEKEALKIQTKTYFLTAPEFNITFSKVYWRTQDALKALSEFSDDLEREAFTLRDKEMLVADIAKHKKIVSRFNKNINKMSMLLNPEEERIRKESANQEEEREIKEYMEKAKPFMNQIIEESRALNSSIMKNLKEMAAPFMQNGIDLHAAQQSYEKKPQKQSQPLEELLKNRREKANTRLRLFLEEFNEGIKSMQEVTQEMHSMSFSHHNMDSWNRLKELIPYYQRLCEGIQETLVNIKSTEQEQKKLEAIYLKSSDEFRQNVINALRRAKNAGIINY